MEAIYANTKRISTGLYNNILNICNKDQLEQEVTYGTVLKRPKNESLECNNTYRRHR